MATTPTIWVLNELITLPSKIQYNDSNGNPVETLYPYDYLVLLGQDLNNTIIQLNSATAILSGQTAQINTLFMAVASIPPAYVLPSISPQCLGLSGTTQPLDTLLASMITTWCSFTGVMGTNSNLLKAVGTECSNLSLSPSFGHLGSSMSGISGWITNPTTVSDSLINMWLTICDARAGITTTLAAVTPTCSQVIINFTADIPSYQTGINVFLDGYTFIPTGFTDNGSTIKIVDNSGNIYQTTINIVTQSTSSSAFNIPLVGTALSPTSNYTIYLNSNVINTTLGLTCVKTTIFNLNNNNIVCPSINTIPGQLGITITLYPYITTNVIYIVDLLSASGTTLQSAQFSNPPSVQTYMFTGLNSSTPYSLKPKVQITSSPLVTCSLISVSTTS